MLSDNNEEQELVSYPKPRLLFILMKLGLLPKTEKWEQASLGFLMLHGVQ